MPFADPAGAVRWLRIVIANVDLLHDIESSDSYSTNEETFEEAKGVTFECLSGISQLAKVAVSPEFADVLTDHIFYNRWDDLRQGLRIVAGEIENAAFIADVVGPQGPQLAAQRFHPWVWTSAERLWSDGHRRAAVQTAGASVEQQLRAKLDDHKQSAKNLCDAFKLDQPKPDQPRLRLGGYADGTADQVSAHEGAQFFGRGCFQAIRNLSSHSADEMPEQEALEQLAALSVLARWVDEAIVVKVAAETIVTPAGDR